VADIRGSLSQLGFSYISMDVANRYSIADLFPNKRERCGIYVLHFDDGEYYVGQSIDVVKRHSQHAKTYDDIARLSFMPAKREDLNVEEVRVVKVVEALGEHLRNIQIVEFSYGDTDLEGLISREDLTWWLQDINNVLTSNDWIDDARQRRRYHRRASDLLDRPRATEAVVLGNMFIQATIPAPYLTERTFWACTLQEQTGWLYYRINVGGQTTFQVWRNLDGTLLYGVFLPRPSAAEIYGDLSEVHGDLALIFSGNDPDAFVEIASSSLKQGHADQVAILSPSAEMMAEVILDPALVMACRRFHVKLMQKGPCRWAQNHVFDLADLLLAPFEGDEDIDQPAATEA
jgi:hypothetical protein